VETDKGVRGGQKQNLGKWGSCKIIHLEATQSERKAGKLQKERYHLVVAYKPKTGGGCEMQVGAHICGGEPVDAGRKRRSQLGRRTWDCGTKNTVKLGPPLQNSETALARFGDSRRGKRIQSMQCNRKKPMREKYFACVWVANFLGTACWGVRQ